MQHNFISIPIEQTRDSTDYDILLTAHSSIIVKARKDEMIVASGSAPGFNLHSFLDTANRIAAADGDRPSGSISVTAVPESQQAMWGQKTSFRYPLHLHMLGTNAEENLRQILLDNKDSCLEYVAPTETDDEHTYPKLNVTAGRDYRALPIMLDLLAEACTARELHPPTHLADYILDHLPYRKPRP